MNNDLEQFSEERLKELASTPEKYDHRYTCNLLNGDESRALARIALAAKQAKPVGYLFVSPDGGIAYSISNVEFEGVKLVGPIYSTPQPAHTEQDGWISIPKDMLADYRDVKNGEVQSYKASFGSHCDIPGSRWQRDLADLTEELAKIDKLLAAAPKPGGWIKCSDDLPDETEDADGGATGYLVRYENDRVPNGGFNIGVSNCVFLRTHWRGMYTHWMPLPAAPKPESE